MNTRVDALVVLLTGVLILLASHARAAEPKPGFTDISDRSGVWAIVADHYKRLPKWWLSGMTLVDLDGDGDLDLHLAGHGSPAVAGFNDGKGRFTGVDPKLKIPRGIRKKNDLPYPGGEIRLVYDVNEDGKPDIFCSWHDGGGVTYLNYCKPGNPPVWNFKVYNPGFNCFSRAVAMVDLNRDGIADYLATGDGKEGRLWIAHGRHGGTWKSDASVPVMSESGAVPADIDGDGDLDLLVSRRGYIPPGRRILLNDGKMKFTDATAEAGLKPESGSIHGFGDVDQDGAPDLICVEGRDIVLYLNDGKGRFARGPDVVGVKKLRIGPRSANWGGAIVTDFDNDGVADVVVNGKYFLYVLRGRGGGKLELVNAAWGLPSSVPQAVDEGLCFGDIDDDGDLDVVTYGASPVPKKRGIGVFRNDLPARHWLRVRLIGAKGNRAAAGAKIRIYQAGALGDRAKLLWYEQVAIWGRQSFHSYYFHTATERHFGLGDRETVDLSVTFYPSGKTVEKKGAKANTVVAVRELTP